jgi:hypothetical protein
MEKRLSMPKVETNAGRLVKQAEGLLKEQQRGPSWMMAAIGNVEGMRKEISDGRYLFEESMKDSAKRFELREMNDASAKLTAAVGERLKALDPGMKGEVLRWVWREYPSTYGRGTPINEEEVLRPKFGKAIDTLEDWVRLQDPKQRLMAGAWAYERPKDEKVKP